MDDRAVAIAAHALGVKVEERQCPMPDAFCRETEMRHWDLIVQLTEDLAERESQRNLWRVAAYLG